MGTYKLIVQLSTQPVIPQTSIPSKVYQRLNMHLNHFKPKTLKKPQQTEFISKFHPQDVLRS